MTTTTQAHTDVDRRHDFVLLFDVQDGNPNGDPDAGNLPRVDNETMQGLVTDVSLKRKVRDWVDASNLEQARYKIYVQHGKFLANQRARVFGERAEGRQGIHDTEARDWMCQEFFDIRMFGAVMSMREYNAGQVRGPVQMTFARSVDPILPMDFAIVGPAQNEKDVNRPSEEENAALNYGTMGRKATVPYALYLGYGFFNPHFAKQTRVTPEDLYVLWNALVNMWDLDRSSSRGLMSCRGLYVFSHESSMGNAPAHRLFDLVGVEKNDGVEAPRKFRDYTVTVNEEGIPDGVSLTRLEG